MTLRERIFVPLGMNASNTSINDLKGQENVAAPHAAIKGEVRPIPWCNLDNIAPAGSINSNAVEMAEWLRLHLGGRTYQGQQLLTAAAIKEMHSPQFLIHTWDAIAFVRQTVDMDSHFWAYGLGWFVTDYHGRKMIWHIGGIDGMGCAVGLIPQENVGIVVLVNKHYTWIHFPLMLWLFDAILGRPQRDWCSDFLALEAATEAQKEVERQKMQGARVEGTAMSLPLSECVGACEYEPYGQVIVAQENGRLLLEFNPVYVGDLEHWHYDTFRVIWRNPILDETYLTFNLNVKGKIEGIKIEGLQGFESH